MTRVLAVIGGKGGVGKTSLVSNLAAALTDLGNDVIAIDANLTTPNLGFHLGYHLAPKTLHHVLKGRAKLKDAIYHHSYGFRVIPGSISNDELKGVDVGKLPEVMVNLIGKADYVLMDSAAGLGREAVASIGAANEILIITNPDIPSVTDALKTVKIAESLNKKIVGVAVNRIKGKNYELERREIEDMVGYPVISEIPEDNSLEQALAAKKTLIEMNKKSPAAKEIRRLAYTLEGKHFSMRERISLFEKIRNIFSR
jgi:septum site-determining protein MinD